MNYEQIKDLLNSGFTPDQITALTTSGTIPSAPDSLPEDPTPAPAVSESPVKEDVPESPDSGAPSEGDSNNEPDPLEEIRETVRQLQEENKQLKDQIQTANIRDRTIPSVHVPDAADTLAEVIRPSFKKGV